MTITNRLLRKCRLKHSLHRELPLSNLGSLISFFLSTMVLCNFVADSYYITGLSSTGTTCVRKFEGFEKSDKCSRSQALSSVLWLYFLLSYRYHPRIRFYFILLTEAPSVSRSLYRLEFVMSWSWAQANPDLAPHIWARFALPHLVHQLPRLSLMSPDTFAIDLKQFKKYFSSLPWVRRSAR